MVCGLVSGVQQQLEGDQFPIPAMNAMIFPSNKANEAEADIMIVDIISPRMEGTEKLVWLSKHLMPAISLLATFACSPSNLTLSVYPLHSARCKHDSQREEMSRVLCYQQTTMLCSSGCPLRGRPALLFRCVWLRRGSIPYICW